MAFEDIKAFFYGNANQMKEEEYREKLQQNTLADANKNILILSKEIKSENKEDTDDAIVLTALELAFRFLRNACIACKANQLLISNHEILDTTLQCLQLITHPKCLTESQVQQDLTRRTQRIGVQFIGNLVAGNEISQDIIWKKTFPQMLFALMNSLDPVGKDTLCMVIFNCLRNRTNLFIDDANEVWLMISVLDHLKEDQDAEWGLFILEHVISSGQFQELYKRLGNYYEHRVTFLDLLHAHLDDSKTNDIPEQIFIFLADQLQSTAQCIFQLSTDDTNEALEQASILVLRYLQILCAATTFQVKYQNLLRKMSLLEIAVGLLKSASTNELRDKFEGSNQIEHQFHSGDVHPFHGFKRDLIRLIGNMCYHQQANQNKVRELEGLTVILESCTIDARNPYICQWAIFAIRNLCEDNPLNQAFIAGLERQGLAPNAAGERSGMEVSLENGRIRIKQKGNR